MNTNPALNIDFSAFESNAINAFAMKKLMLHKKHAVETNTILL